HRHYWQAVLSRHPCLLSACGRHLTQVNEVSPLRIVLLDKEVNGQTVRHDGVYLPALEGAVAACIPKECLLIYKAVSVLRALGDVICLVIRHEDWASVGLSVHLVTVDGR